MLCSGLAPEQADISLNTEHKFPFPPFHSLPSQISPLLHESQHPPLLYCPPCGHPKAVLARRTTYSFSILGLFIGSVAYQTVRGNDESPVRMNDLTYDATNFAEGSTVNLTMTPDGLTIAADQFSGSYTSPVIEAPHGFNVIVPQWVADYPENATMALLVRTQKAGGEWTEWQGIHGHADLVIEGDPTELGDFITISGEDETHNLVQFSFNLSRENSLSNVLLRRVTFTVIDSTAGPTTVDLQQRQAERDAALGVRSVDGTPRPQVISRDVWCTSDSCDYTSGLEYAPATHMIVHHTVSSNSSTNWAAVVRAIWNFHAFSRGWGDIGYNYLIDRNGVIYEGHMNQDYDNLDVVGTHAAAGNAGGFGVSLIGTYTTAAEYSTSSVPPQPMVDSLVNLLAWKADQRNIEVYSSSRMRDTSWGLPHIMGHRDVYGGLNTLCPGGHAHELLPTVRARVAETMGYQNPYIFVSATSGNVPRSNANWYEAERGCGWQGHAYYTWSTTNPSESSNWVEYRPDVPRDGYYEAQVYAPYCTTRRAETSGATYDITHANGTSRVTVSHNDNVGLWMSLGEFELAAGSGNVVRLSDLTTTDNGLGVWVDDIRLIEVNRPPTAVSTAIPTSEALLMEQTVEFEWNIVAPEGVRRTHLQVATDAGFANMVVDQNWETAVSSHSHTFTQDYAQLFWRAVLTLEDNSTLVTTAVPFSLDALAPTSSITGIYQIMGGDYVVSWEGNDDASGIAGYTVQYRIKNNNVWTNWLVDTAATSAIFSPTSSAIYEFQTIATDAVGHVEIPMSSSSTEQSVTLSHAILLPMIKK